MNLTLAINRCQDDDCNLPAEGWVIRGTYRLTRILDMRDLDQAEGWAAQIDEETELVTA